MKRLGFPQVRYYTLVHLSHSSNRVFKDWQQGCWTCISNWETKTQKISQEYAELLLSNRDWMETHCLRTGDWGRDTRLEKQLYTSYTNCRKESLLLLHSAFLWAPQCFCLSERETKIVFINCIRLILRFILVQC